MRAVVLHSHDGPESLLIEEVDDPQIGPDEVLVDILGYNEMPRLRGRGSAIFMHLAHGDDRATHYKPTAGCIAAMRRARAVGGTRPTSCIWTGYQLEAWRTGAMDAAGRLGGWILGAR